MSAFSDFVGDGLDKIKASNRNPLLEPVGYVRAQNGKTGDPGIAANYKLKVNRCVFGKAQSSGAPYFAAEFDVLESNNPSIRAGSQAAYIISFAQYPEKGKQAILNLLMKGFGLDEAEAKDAIVKDTITGEAQVLAGEELNATVLGEYSPKSNKLRVTYRWSEAA